MAKSIESTACHCLKLRRGASNVVAYYDTALSSSGVTAQQYALLYQLSLQEGCNVRTLAEACELDRSTLARSLKPLLNRGLIEDRKKENSRDSSMWLTESGSRVCQQAAELWAQAQARFEELLGSERVQLLEETLVLLQQL